MSRAIEILQRGVALHREGRLREAAEAYRQVLKADSRNADALNLLGQACCRLGEHQEAVRQLKKCLKIRPAFAPAHANLGEVMNAMGDHEAAVVAFRRAIALMPELAEAHSGQGYALLRLGRCEEAIACCEKALAIRPGSVETLNLMGNALLSLQRLPEAEACFRAALDTAPDFVPTLNNLGNVLSTQGQHAEAEKCLRHALALAPDFLFANYNLGLTLAALKRDAEAEACFRKTLSLDPGHAPAWSSLAAVLCTKGLLLEAEACCRKSLAQSPNYYDALVNLGDVLNALGSFGEAKASYMKALLQQDPNSFAVYSSLLFVEGYTGVAQPEWCLEQARQCGRMLAGQVERRFSSWVVDPAPERLRVGFVSGDLREHPVGFFLESVLMQLDPARFELLAYPTLSTEDGLTARIRPRFLKWTRIVGKTDQEAAEIIHADGVHVLVDLSGHTAHNRLPVFARRPAPVQLSWLGYFATTGLEEMDYLLADEVGVPPPHRAHFSEEVLYLPETRLCYTAPALSIDVSPLPALSNGFITFSCFQNLSKIGERVLDAWSRVLAALPGARLRLQAKQYADPVLKERFVDRCRLRGIDASRLLICENTPREAYFSAHNEVDVILDTFPYPGGTTTCDALWMGVPTLTLAGDTLLARQGASLMTAAGLPEWVATSEEDYVERAIAFSSDTAALAALRAGLRQQVLASPLFDAARFARHLENALWDMWRAKGLGRVKAEAASPWV